MTKGRILVCLIAFLSLISPSISKAHPLHNEVMGIISSQPTKVQFKLWHFAFQKTYDINSEVGLKKYKAFKENIKYIKEQNEKQNKYTLGLGPFTDLSWEEFSIAYLNLDIDHHELSDKNPRKKKNARKLGWFDDMVDKEEMTDRKNLKYDDEDEEDHDHFDGVSKNWRELVNYSRDQGQCGSCWAFSAMAAIEAALYVQGAKDIDLSEQQLNDCVLDSTGCEGGTQMDAFMYSMKYGIMKEADYPYVANDQECKYEKSKVAVKVKYFEHCTRGHFKCDKERIYNMLQIAPISSSLHAGRSFQHYRLGQIAPEWCEKINHGILVTFADFKNGVMTIRNSWGPTWGDNGFADVYIGEHEGLKGCGLLEYAYQPREVTLTGNSDDDDSSESSDE